MEQTALGGGIAIFIFLIIFFGVGTIAVGVITFLLVGLVMKSSRGKGEPSFEMTVEEKIEAARRQGMVDQLRKMERQHALAMAQKKEREKLLPRASSQKDDDSGDMSTEEYEKFIKSKMRFR